MKTVELELTFLAKYIPDGLLSLDYTEIEDVFFPESARHPILRLRRRDKIYEITKKQPIIRNDSSAQTEDTIALSQEEHEALAMASSKGFLKRRYRYPYNGVIAEIDVYQRDLAGLVVVDFEFENDSDKEKFIIPGFCLVDITQEETFAGGMLCGKKYEDVESSLNKLGYKKILT